MSAPFLLCQVYPGDNSVSKTDKTPALKKLILNPSTAGQGEGRQKKHNEQINSILSNSVTALRNTNGL